GEIQSVVRARSAPIQATGPVMGWADVMAMRVLSPACAIGGSRTAPAEWHRWPPPVNLPGALEESDQTKQKDSGRVQHGQDKEGPDDEARGEKPADPVDH